MSKVVAPPENIVSLGHEPDSIIRGIEEFYHTVTINFGNAEELKPQPKHLEEFKDFLEEKYQIVDFGKGTIQNEAIKRLIKFVKNEGIYYPPGFKRIALSKQIIPPKSSVTQIFFGEGGIGAKSSLLIQYLLGKSTLRYDPTIGIIFILISFICKQSSTKGGFYDWINNDRIITLKLKDAKKVIARHNNNYINNNGRNNK
jgi:hypothetical protein